MEILLKLELPLLSRDLSTKKLKIHAIRRGDEKQFKAKTQVLGRGDRFTRSRECYLSLHWLENGQSELETEQSLKYCPIQVVS